MDGWATADLQTRHGAFGVMGDGEGAEVEAVFDADRQVMEEALASIRERLGPIPIRDEGLVEGRAVWAEPGRSEPIRGDRSRHDHS